MVKLTAQVPWCVQRVGVAVVRDFCWIVETEGAAGILWLPPAP
jgi:hypothetical protein